MTHLTAIYCPYCGSDHPGPRCGPMDIPERHAPMDPTDEERRAAEEFSARWELENRSNRETDDRPEND